MYADNEKYMCIDSSATSAVNLEWFIKNIITGFAPEPIHPDNIYQLIDQKIARFAPDEVQIIYLPFIYKSKLTKKTDGGFFGMKASHNVYHLLRAVYEGVAFAHLKHIDNLRKGGIVKQIGSLSGGASKSPFWGQLFADVLNMEIVTTKASQAGALGIAIASTVATGVYQSIEEAVRVMVCEQQRFQPNQNTGAYREKYHKFNRIIDLYDHNIL